MSWEAITWVLEDAPDVPPHLVGTLLGIAIYAGPDGCGSYPSQKTIAWHARKSDRAVRNDLPQLQKLGLIREGNPLLVAHIPKDERPGVWDLPLDRRRDPRERKHTSGPSGGSGSTLPVPRQFGPEAEFRPTGEGTGSVVPVETEGAEAHFRANGGGTGSGLPTNQKKKTSSSSSPFPVARIAAALGEEEEEARRIYDRVISERKPTAPSRYIDALIASGDIAQFRGPAAKPASSAATHPYEDSSRGYCAKCLQPEKHARHGGRK